MRSHYKPLRFVAAFHLLHLAEDAHGCCCRLPFVRRMMALYDGPLSLAVYIPFPAGTPDAATCRAKVMAYMATSRERVRKAGKDAMPFAMSLLYADAPSPTLHCNLTEASTGFEDPWRDEQLWTSQFGSNATAVDFHYAEYPVGSMRQLAKDAVRLSCCQNVISSRHDICCVLSLIYRSQQWSAEESIDQNSRQFDTCAGANEHVCVPRGRRLCLSGQHGAKAAQRGEPGAAGGHAQGLGGDRHPPGSRHSRV